MTFDVQPQQLPRQELKQKIKGNPQYKQYTHFQYTPHTKAISIFRYLST